MQDKKYLATIVPLGPQARKQIQKGENLDVIRAAVWSETAKKLTPLLGSVCSRFLPATYAWSICNYRPFGVMLGGVTADMEDMLLCYTRARLEQMNEIYFIPRDYMPKLALFEDFIALLEQHNQHKYADRLPLDANSMFVVDDEKQRSKMALAFYRTIQKDLAEYEKRATHLIQSGNQSPAIMDRMVLSIRELERKKIYYESILKQELHEVDEQYTSLRYLSDELQIRARSIQAQKRLAA